MSIQDLTSTVLTSGFSQSIVLGILVASAFPIGVAIASARKFPRQVKGNLAAIAAGIYFSTLAFSLIEEAIKISSFPAMATGFVIGAMTFSIMHPIVKERKRLTNPSLVHHLTKKKKKKPQMGGKEKQSDDSSSSGEMNIIGYNSWPYCSIGNFPLSWIIMI